MEENKNKLPAEGPFLMDEPPLLEEIPEDMPRLDLDAMEPLLLDSVPEAPEEPAAEAPVILCPQPESPIPESPSPEDAVLPPQTGEAAAREQSTQESDTLPLSDHSQAEEEPVSMTDTIVISDLNELKEPENNEWDAPPEIREEFMAPPTQEAPPSQDSHTRTPRKGRPKRKRGYGLFGIPHLLATVVWLGIILMIGVSLGRMLWVCAADVLAFGRESKQVSVTITSRDTIDDIAEKLHDAELIRYPQVFKLYAKLAVDEGDILPGTFQLDTIYDYHALVVQMGPRSSTRTVVEDLLIPEGLNCRQIFELLEQHNICTVRELEEYAANGEFSDFWFLEGVERGDKYCLEGYLFPDTYDFYEHSTPREAIGKMLLGFQARVDQEETITALAALNERLGSMMRINGCGEDHIAEHQLGLRELLTVASLIEEETASATESPLIASVIFNRLTQDQVYERYLNIDAAIIYATGDPNNIDTSIDHPYNTYKNAGLTPGPISNPGLESIQAALNFESSEFYYYVLNPETDMHQFSKTLQEHEQWVETFRNMATEDTE